MLLSRDFFRSISRLMSVKLVNPMRCIHTLHVQLHTYLALAGGVTHLSLGPGSFGL